MQRSDRGGTGGNRVLRYQHADRFLSGKGAGVGLADVGQHPSGAEHGEQHRQRDGQYPTLHGSSFLARLVAWRGSAAELDFGGTQVRAANWTGRRDQPTYEEAIDALVRARAVVRGVQPVRRGRAGQLVTGDDQGSEAFQGVDSVTAGTGDRGVDRDVDRNAAAPRGGQRLRAGRPGGPAGVSTISAAVNVRRAG